VAPPAQLIRMAERFGVRRAPRFPGCALMMSIEDITTTAHERGTHDDGHTAHTRTQSRAEQSPAPPDKRLRKQTADNCQAATQPVHKNTGDARK
jgi:hypothetical protein